MRPYQLGEKLLEFYDAYRHGGPEDLPASLVDAWGANFPRNTGIHVVSSPNIFGGTEALWDNYPGNRGLRQGSVIMSPYRGEPQLWSMAQDPMSTGHSSYMTAPLNSIRADRIPAMPSTSGHFPKPMEESGVFIAAEPRHRDRPFHMAWSPDIVRQGNDFELTLDDTYHPGQLFEMGGFPYHLVTQPQNTKAFGGAFDTWYRAMAAPILPPGPGKL